jgi:hypothetical protein
MAECHMAQLMGDHAGQFLRRHFAPPVFLVETARKEDAPVRRGQPVDHVHLVQVHANALDAECCGHPVGQRLQARIGQFGGLLVQLPTGAPAGELVHRQRVDDGKQDWRELQHYRDMGPRGHVGNGRHMIRKNGGIWIKCGDIVAANSVFP